MNVARPLLLACVLASALGWASSGWASPGWASSGWAADTNPATQAKNDGNACTWFRTIDDWRRLDDRNLIVWASRNEAYRVELTMRLMDLNTADAIGFIDRNHDGRLCGFGMDEIVVPHSPVFNTSTIASMTRLDDAGMAALAQQYNIKLRYVEKKSAAKGAEKSDS